MKSVLEFDSLELTYDGRSVLSGVYMKCEVGEVVGLLGRNGSGKSSLMKIVFGSLKAQHQSIRINGQSLHPDHLTQRLIGYLPQGNLIPSSLSVRQALRLFKISEAGILSHFPEINVFLNLNSSQLSGGYRRIIETFLILKSKTKFCILDEPFSGLMPIHIQKVREIINSEKSNKGIIITDHLYRDVITMADRLYLLANGTTYLVKNQEDLIMRGYITSL